MKPERLAAILVLITGMALRLYQLPLAPLHHDEGINGFFMMNLFREGTYRYDPANYHGPSLYYLDLPLVHTFGLETFSLRLLPALFGIAVLVLLLSCRIFSSRIALYSAALAAVSPGMVYFSRYFIHEMMVVFFTLGIVYACTLHDQRLRGLRIIVAAFFTGFLFATKETAAPTVVVLVIALATTYAVMRFTQGGRSSTAPPASPPSMVACCGAVICFAAINGSLYTSFLNNPVGLNDALHSLAFWTATGTKEHVHPMWQYLVWMLKEESAVLFLGCSGIALAFFRRDSYAAVFCGFWSLGMLSIYSLLPYKTPWLSINIILPLTLMAGYALDGMPHKVRSSLIACAVAIGLTQSLSLNFVHYDDNRYPYVYAHTVRDINRLVDDVDALVKESGSPATIAVVAKEYWPLPWMFKSHDQALFHGGMAPLHDVQFVVAQPGQKRAIVTEAKGRLKEVGTYLLRPGVDLVLWADYSLCAR